MGFKTSVTEKDNENLGATQVKKEKEIPPVEKKISEEQHQTEVKPYQSSKQFETLSISGYDKRGEIVESARRLIGIRDSFESRSFIAHILKVNNIKIAGSGELSTKSLYDAMTKQGVIFRDPLPAKGDIVFLNLSGEMNAGVVESVRDDGTVEFIAYIDNVVNRYRINAAKPEVRKVEKSGETVNSLIKITGAKGATTAGKLFAGYGRVVK